ncbi:DUF1254 domain-containing protein [Nocardioides zeae]|uniref:DUF1254 domain-containing protein n=1 Tax=Nocardioides imazamoxiresistens TaxID=3231893 RepID=A0ABU3PVF0_9ACTN|nr:DUF1254 domain-containing protein [Nocardioides zeae]MDT9592797.1 DUF1254 domain-containing protein [Nocardioides zeae]
MVFRGQTPTEAVRAASAGRADALPADPEQRRLRARTLASLATVYGLPAVLQHDLLRREVWGPDASPLSTFRHERAVATPQFAGFRVPNVDTLYSSAWVDLTGGPVDVTLPDLGGRYYTLQLLDAFSNATNLSRRTAGDARRFTLVPPGATPPDDGSGRMLVQVDSRVTWVLMRIQVGADDHEVVRALQDQVALEPRGGSSIAPEAAAGDVETEVDAFLETLDAALRLQGHPPEDDALVAQLRSIGIAGTDPFDARLLDEATALGVGDGFAEAMELVSANRSLLGTPTPGGWTRVADKGSHGANHLNRAIMNYVGLGANVEEENTSFNTYVDADGQPLDGRRAYEISLDAPPDCDAFWSITLYEAATGMLYDAPDGRHGVGSASGGRGAAVSGRIVVGPDRADGDAWLPTPPGPFFLVLRIYAPGAAVVSHAWTPPPLRAR